MQYERTRCMEGDLLLRLEKPEMSQLIFTKLRLYFQPSLPNETLRGYPDPIITFLNLPEKKIQIS